MSTKKTKKIKNKHPKIREAERQKELDKKRDELAKAELNDQLKDFLEDEKNKFFCYKKNKNWYCKICNKKFLHYKRLYASIAFNKQEVELGEKYEILSKIKKSADKIHKNEAPERDRI